MYGRGKKGEGGFDSITMTENNTILLCASLFSHVLISRLIIYFGLLFTGIICLSNFSLLKDKLEFMQLFIIISHS